MDIQNNFYSANAYIEKSQEKIEARDYISALTSLRKAYSHIRALMIKVGKLQAMKDEVTEQK